MKTEYQDGFYKLVNTSNVITEIEIKHGIVFVVNGFCGGSTNKPVEHYLHQGFKLLDMNNQDVITGLYWGK